MKKSDQLLDHLKELSGPRQVCQYQFKINDIVWICKQCQKDETCVLCNNCYQKSSHIGHEVFFYHSAAGGCCDCGDHQAWYIILAYFSLNTITFIDSSGIQKDFALIMEIKLKILYHISPLN